MLSQNPVPVNETDPSVRVFRPDPQKVKNHEKGIDNARAEYYNNNEV
jgi:hypothetical protein